MSALGQKQTCAVQKGMSALPPKADMCDATRDVRFAPKADLACLFDHFIGSGEKDCWHSNAKLFRGLEIDR